MAKKTAEEKAVFGVGDPYAPILQNLNGLVFLFQQESGVYLQSYERNISGTREDVFDVSLGYDIGFVEYNFQAAYTVKGRVVLNAGNPTGIAAAAPGVVLALNNSTTGNGVSAGGVYTETIGNSHAEKGFLEVSVTALQKPGIP